MHLTFTAWVQSHNTPHYGGGKHIDPVKNEYHCMILFPLVTIRSVFPLLQAKSQIYAHIYRHTTVQNTTVKSHTHTHDRTTVLTYLEWNTSVTGHKQGTVGFPQGKNLPRSTANSLVSTSTLQFTGRQTAACSFVFGCKFQFDPLIYEPWYVYEKRQLP